MEISKNKVVELAYELHFDDFNGEIAENVTKDTPFTFIFDTGFMLESFEKNIKGLKKGDNFKFKIDCEEAYGQVDEKSILDLPKESFIVNGKFDDKVIYKGAHVPMKDENNNEYDGFVMDVTNDTVKVDFNHPMAGEDLFFTGTVINVREATAEELSHGHVHSHSCNH